MPPTPPRTAAAQSLLVAAESLPRRAGAARTWRVRSFASFMSPEERAEKLEEEKRKLSLWLDEKGQPFRRPTGQPSYLGPAQNQPFPQNPMFRSQPVLSFAAKDVIWKRVMHQGQPIKAVSVELGVDLRRIAAVVRLREMEEKWKDEGKKLAGDYAAAVMGMLPQTKFEESKARITPHEPINDLHVHSWTTQQLFVPTPESRYFTREDAAKAFHPRMLPADQRLPHPELVGYEKDLSENVPPEEARAKYLATISAEELVEAETERKRTQAEQSRTKDVVAGRFTFRFKEISVDDVGRKGRSRRGTGWRYGVPFSDRRRGEVKISTEVE